MYTSVPLKFSHFLLKQTENCKYKITSLFWLMMHTFLVSAPGLMLCSRQWWSDSRSAATAGLTAVILWWLKREMHSVILDKNIPHYSAECGYIITIVSIYSFPQQIYICISSYKKYKSGILIIQCAETFSSHVFSDVEKLTWN